MNAKDLRAELDATPPTEQELEQDVTRSALNVRRARLQLARFGAGARSTSALALAIAALDQAVERLAAFRESNGR